MEMNTRLQVEHPVSEMISGLDLVEWQIRVASGEPLPLKQDDIKESGHAFEARIYAEDPEKDFAPSTGALTHLSFPKEDVRIDSGVAQGLEISPYYDPMIAKLVVRGGDRNAALAQLSAALSQTQIAGVKTNIGFLSKVGLHPAFRSGDISTGFIQTHATELFSGASPSNAVFAAAIVSAYERAKRQQTLQINPGFRLNQSSKLSFPFQIDGEDLKANLTVPDASKLLSATIHSASDDAERSTFDFSYHYESPSRLAIIQDDHYCTLQVFEADDAVFIFDQSLGWTINYPNGVGLDSGASLSEGSLTAPMPGVVTQIHCEIGQAVRAGDPLMIMEAMKMEHAIKSPHDGMVTEIYFQAGDQVKDGELLVKLENE